ncbi:serine threonine kinase [Fusarium albosuccineum]|uniref:non-specific serine/threonine protein kinase n=1 Tax=Fusarium albosuccineum TaxID=1237068 RepID=A0A8H4L8X5_9HYPO|nr:serine threonine kinase [Fusarium albosuccineum]
MMNSWRKRICYYSQKAEKSFQKWNELESSKDEIAAHLRKSYGSGRDSFDSEWQEVRAQLERVAESAEKLRTATKAADQLWLSTSSDSSKLPIINNGGEDEADWAGWFDALSWRTLYSFWKKRPQQQRYSQMCDSSSKEGATPVEKKAKDYHNCIYWLDMLAMPLSIWSALVDFRDIEEHNKVRFVLIQKPALPPNMGLLKVQDVCSELEDWDENLVRTGKTLDAWKRLKGGHQTKYLHCELQILMLFHQLSSGSGTFFSTREFIGSSKLSCHLCWEMLKHGKYKTRGTHGKVSENWAFPFPSSLNGAVERFVDFKQRWTSFFKQHSHGNFPYWPSQIDTDPAHTEGNDFDKEIARAQLRELCVNEYHSNNPQHPFQIEQGIKSGTGTFGTVYAASLSHDPESYHSSTKITMRYALKRIIVTDHAKLDLVKREITTLRKLDHNNVLVLREPFFNAADPRVVYLATSPWAPETLRDVLLASIGPQEGSHRWYQPGVLDPWPSIVKQCADGLNHLHEKDIKHKDIKPKNILLGHIDRDGDIEIRPIIADFNLSKDDYTSRSHTDNLGTYEFKAPEQVCAGSRDVGTLKSDVWSLGCCFACIAILIHAGPDELSRVWGNSAELGFHKSLNLGRVITMLEADSKNIYQLFY